MANGQWNTYAEVGVVKSLRENMYISYLLAMMMSFTPNARGLGQQITIEYFVLRFLPYISTISRALPDAAAHFSPRLIFYSKICAITYLLFC